MEKKCEYTSSCHLVVDGEGHVWPDSKENREVGRQTKVTLTEGQAARYGSDLVKLGGAKEAEVTHDKQVTTTSTK